MDEWGDHIKRFNLPILFSDTIQYPDELGKGFIYPLDEDGYDLWSIFAVEIGLACGLTNTLMSAAIINSLLNVHSIPADWLSND